MTNQYFYVRLAAANSCAALMLLCEAQGGLWYLHYVFLLSFGLLFAVAPAIQDWMESKRDTVR